MKNETRHLKAPVSFGGQWHWPLWRFRQRLGSRAREKRPTFGWTFMTESSHRRGLRCTLRRTFSSGHSRAPVRGTSSFEPARRPAPGGRAVPAWCRGS